MLTKSDLSQIKKLIQEETRKIVREEVEVELDDFKSSLTAELKLTRMRIEGEIGQLSNRVKNLEIASRRIEKKLDKAIDFLDRDIMNTLKRVERIETHLKLPSISQI